MLIDHKTKLAAYKNNPEKKYNKLGFTIFSNHCLIYWSFSDWPTWYTISSGSIQVFYYIFKVCNSKFSLFIIFLLLHDTKIEAKNKNHLWAHCSEFQSRTGWLHLRSGSPQRWHPRCPGDHIPVSLEAMVKNYLQDYSGCWQTSFPGGCRTEAAVSLLAVSWGHSQ